MKEGLIKDAYEIIIKEIQTMLSILYLLMIGIGMLFNYYKHAEFGINIFQYADILDFLIAPFEDSGIIVMSIFSLMIPLIIFGLDRASHKRYPKIYSKVNFGWDKKPWYNLLRIFMFLFLCLYFIFEFALGYGRYMKRVVEKQNPIIVVFADNTTRTGKMIGKTKEVLFVLENEKVSVIPLTSLVKEIKIR